jgi:glucose-1-phosphate cytidylyltransferase
MKVIVLAGGLGSRISEETTSKPKPMVSINDEPILSHIFRIYAMQGVTDFIVALGYKGDYITSWLEERATKAGKDLFKMKLNLLASDNSSSFAEITIETLDTGLHSQTGGRIKQCLERYPNETLMATYGDGLANVSIHALLSSHSKSKKLATVTAVRPAARFGFLEIQDGSVLHFGEKDQADAGWINGGFFVLNPEVVNYIKNDQEPFESGALPRLVNEKQLNAYQHFNFFKPMDTLREKNELEELAKSPPIPWLHGI